MSTNILHFSIHQTLRLTLVAGALLSAHAASFCDAQSGQVWFGMDSLRQTRFQSEWSNPGQGTTTAHTSWSEITPWHSEFRIAAVSGLEAGCNWSRGDVTIDSLIAAGNTFQVATRTFEAFTRIFDSSSVQIQGWTTPYFGYWSQDSSLSGLAVDSLLTASDTLPHLGTWLAWAWRKDSTTTGTGTTYNTYWTSAPAIRLDSAAAYKSALASVLDTTTAANTIKVDVLMLRVVLGEQTRPTTITGPLPLPAKRLNLQHPSKWDLLGRRTVDF